MLGGWRSSSSSTNFLPPPLQSSKDEDGFVVGKILGSTSTGAWTFEIELQSENGNDKSSNWKTTVLVKLNVKRFPDLKPWMKIRKARKLLCPGVSLLVYHSRSMVKEDNGNINNDGDGKQIQTIHARKIQIVAVLPITTYLGRLLSFSEDQLELLFDGNLIHAAYALRPCTLPRLEELLRIVRATKRLTNNREENNSSNLFNHTLLLELCDEIRIEQGWLRGPQKAPSNRITQPMWLALLRMEQQWLTHNEVDGDIENGDAFEMKIHSDDDDHHQPQQIIYGGINVDPSLNIPDPTDQKRISYIDQLKRPQVMWMVRHICRLIGFSGEQNNAKEKNSSNTNTPSSPAKRKLHFIDIGGGRGDLAIAVAAYFTQFSTTIQSHVTVLDVNKSSLHAAEKRSAAASLSNNMSFICQDITDRDQLLQKLSCPQQQHGRVNLVFGLHCCGGLAEAAVDVALFLGANFSVTTCCFRSHQHLAVLSRIADGRYADNANDRDLVASLAVLVKSKGQHRGIRVLNAMRLAAARQKWSTSNDSEGRVLKVWQETFPIQYSVQNRIINGVIHEVSTHT